MRYLYFTTLFALILLLTSCSADEKEYAMPEPDTTVKVLTRNVVGDELNLPLRIYAFDNAGHLAANLQPEQTASGIELPLAAGVKYTIVAVAASNDYVVPASPTLSSLITIAGDRKYATSPLLMGQASITPSVTATTVNISLAYKVAGLNIVLGGLPDDITAASVCVGQQYQALSIGGNSNAADVVEVPCTKVGDAWQTGMVYVMAGANDHTQISISTIGSVSEVYAYTYNSPLRAGTPYILRGTYQDGEMKVMGSITPATWSEPVELDFDFGPGAATDTPAGGDTPASSTCPLPATAWNSHAVALVLDDNGNTITDGQAPAGSTVELLLLSLNDWNSLPSALNASNGNTIATMAEAYTEYDLTGWTIPTEAEVALLTRTYNANSVTTMQNLTAINQLFESLEASPLVYDGSSSNYLATDGIELFDFSRYWSSTGSASKSKTDYHLRLVKRVQITVE